MTEVQVLHCTPVICCFLAICWVMRWDVVSNPNYDKQKVLKSELFPEI